MVAAVTVAAMIQLFFVFFLSSTASERCVQYIFLLIITAVSVTESVTCDFCYSVSAIFTYWS